MVYGKRHEYGPQDPSEKQETRGSCRLNKFKIGIVETQPYEAFRELLQCKKKGNGSKKF